MQIKESILEVTHRAYIAITPDLRETGLYCGQRLSVNVPLWLLTSGSYPEWVVRGIEGSDFVFGVGWGFECWLGSGKFAERFPFWENKQLLLQV